jgi:hypothetical protein
MLWTLLTPSKYPPGCHYSCSISPQLLLLLLQQLPRLSNGCLLLLQLLPLQLQLLQPLGSRAGLCFCLVDTALELWCRKTGRVAGTSLHSTEQQVHTTI